MIPQKTVNSALSILFFGASIVLILVGSDTRPGELECLKSIYSWSPAWDAVNYEWRTFQNGFSETSAYRGSPSTEIEQSWNASLPENPFSISFSEITWLESDMENIAVDINSNIFGRLEVFRNLACLNLLRQHTYRKDYDYSYLASFQGPEDEIMVQVDGCVQRLRQVLMCIGDATPYLIMLTPERRQKESPDFNTLHYCQNFNMVLDWARKNEVLSSAKLPALYTFN